jgi:hypothetical protein
MRLVHNLLDVLVQIPNKMGFKKNIKFLVATETSLPNCYLATKGEYAEVRRSDGLSFHGGHNNHGLRH